MIRMFPAARALLLAAAILIATGVSVYATDEERLPNGITFVHQYIPNIKVVSVQTWMKTGSVNESSDINGISHFLEHMVFKGTEKFGPDEIDQTVESAGGMMNAATSKDYTFYYITIPTFNVETAYKTISEMVFAAKFIPDEIEKEKPVVVQEIARKYDNPTYDMWTTFSETMFGGTTYAQEVIGTADNVKSFTREQLVDYYNRYYHPENMTLVVAGDIKKDEAYKLAMTYFNRKKPVAPGPVHDREKPTPLGESATIVLERQVNQSYGTIGFQTGGLQDADAYTLEVLTEMLSGGEYSILNVALKHEKQLVNRISGGYMGMKTAGAFIFYYTTPNGDVDAVESEIMHIAGQIMDGKIDESTLEKAKNRLKSQTVFQREKSSSEANDIGYSYTLGVKEYYHDFLKRIDNVTKKDIVRVANEIFTKPRLSVRTVPEEAKKAS